MTYDNALFLPKHGGTGVPVRALLSVIVKMPTRRVKARKQMRS